jgi:hypothetical protein
LTCTKQQGLQRPLAIYEMIRNLDFQTGLIKR